ncbi:membrane protein insertase YidC [Carboxylicivirga linearis]|uniref:Membrane protein insertase YidC n=1 Tax=Carboxylicivirga linearis TaxID=1628157 RepID=A0ABS5JYS6_9BACT|nr:membrane protein insertase YidC [Carboxylicivirga linearis]MBS2100057.1 membrane protein insertase YidC [Carboxylicivirga linearis]
MDRNSITGIILIVLIFGFFTWWNQPSDEELAEQKRVRDSIALVEQQNAEAERQAKAAADLAEETKVVEEKDSATIAQEKSSRYGLLADAAEGEQSFVTLENDVMKLTLSNKGARVYSVELKEYKNYDESPVILMDGDKNRFGFKFTHSSRFFHTNDLYFTALPQTSSNKVDFVVNAAEGKLVFSYELPENSYMVDFNIATQNLGNVIATSNGSLDIDWDMEVPAQEKGVGFERRYSGIYYRFAEDDVDHISASGTKTEELRTKLKWVAFKDQFFSSVFISNDNFLSGNVKAVTPEDDNEPVIMDATAMVAVPFSGNDQHSFNFYFGPNDFKALKPYEDLGLRQLVYLGWSFLRYINLGVIEVFHFFERYISNYGLIILLLTVLIKLILFPFTYKSYVSTAKMKVLKPQIEEINKKIPKDKAMERQQATMALYRKAGVNPMGGCLPMLFQMPILFAMFQFFPASIELRGESFLWATDLSSYDAIISWTGDIPLITKFYGNHISLFTLLMAATNIVYTYINQEMTQSSQQMPGMKGMMYMMPVMFLVFFNNYAAGLSYYYFISTLITIGQTLLIRRFVDEKALLAKLKANQKKPSKKSSFQKRLEDMQKQQQMSARNRKK